MTKKEKTQLQGLVRRVWGGEGPGYDQAWRELLAMAGLRSPGLDMIAEGDPVSLWDVLKTELARAETETS